MIGSLCSHVSYNVIGIGIDYFGIGIDYFEIGIGIEVCHKKLNPQINHYHLYLLFYLFY
jgi:microsomal dipeptidase-like Zn-dependent dipeptidase